MSGRSVLSALRWLVTVVVVTLVAALIGMAIGLLVGPAAHAHQAPSGWQYPEACCTPEQDCGRIAPDWVRVTAAGWEVTIPAGGHPVVKQEARTFVVEFRRGEVSPDGEFHICIWPYTGQVLCFYHPPMGV